LDHLDIHEGHARAEPPLEQLAILRRDHDERLGHVVAVDERLDGPQPDRPAIDLGEDLLLLRVAEPRRSSGAGEGDGRMPRRTCLHSGSLHEVPQAASPVPGKVSRPGNELWTGRGCEVNEPAPSSSSSRLSPCPVGRRLTTLFRPPYDEPVFPTVQVV